MPRRRAAVLCGAGAILLALAVPLVAAAGRPTYSHAAQYISELGESGASNAVLVGTLGFVPLGLLVLAFLALAAPELPRSARTTAGLVGMAAVGIAYVVSAIAPCDPGCPGSGSIAQQVHNAFGLLEYVGASTGLLLLGTAFHRSERWRALAPSSVGCAALVLLGFVGMLTPELAPMRGVAQRVAEAGIFLWVALVCVRLTR